MSAKSNRSLTGFLSSIELAVALFLIIAVISALGTIFDLGSGASRADYILSYGEGLTSVIEFLGLGGGKIYSTYWFNTILGLLVINLLLCGANWLPRTLRAAEAARIETDPRRLAGRPDSAVIRAGEDSLDLFAKRLERAGFQVRREGDAIAAERGRLNHWGFFVTHIGFILIVIGAIIGKAVGESGTMVIGEGTMNDTVNLRGGGERILPFALYLDDFTMEYYSDLAVGAEGEEETARWTVDEGDLIRVPGTDYRVRVAGLYPDAYLAPDGHIHPNSRDFLNPLMEVVISEGGNDLESLYLSPVRSDLAEDFWEESEATPVRVRYEIDSHNPPKAWTSYIILYEGGTPRGRKEIRVNEPLDYGGWRFYQLSYDDRNLSYTVLEAKRDPGVPVVYLGCLLLSIGAAFTFFLPHRRVWAVYNDGELTAAAWAHRRGARAREWFGGLLEGIGAGAERSDL